MGGVLIELTGLTRLPWSPWPIAAMDMDVGRAAVPWRGAVDASPGAYFVEWTIEAAALPWAPAADPEPRILPRADRLLFRGRWDPGGTLDVDGSLILVDPVDLLDPPSTAAWLELLVSPADVTVFPYEL
jgi:hypothetical protein